MPNNARWKRALPRLHRPATLARTKLDPLGQRQFARKINRVRLPAHVALPGIAPAFAATAGFLLATERAADFGATGAGIRVGNSTITSGGAHEFFRLTHVVSKDRRRESLRNVILNSERFVKILIRHQIEQWAKRLMLNNVEVRLGIGQ